MFTALKKILITVLILLQLVAPLVHAHASGDWPGTGLHVPGLEKYSVDRSMPETQALMQVSTGECLIIDIDSGLRQEVNANDSDQRQDQVFLLYQDGLPDRHILLGHQINFSPHLQLLIPVAFLLSPLIPRAPPAIN